MKECSFIKNIAILSILLVVVSLTAIYLPKTKTAEIPPKTRVLGESETSWLTYQNESLSFSLKYPSDFEVGDNGTDSVILLKKTAALEADPINLIYISATPLSTTDNTPVSSTIREQLAVLQGINIGESRLLITNNSELESYFKYTRIGDTQISGLPAKTYINEKPWDFPEGTKEYRFYLVNNNLIYLIAGFIETPNSPYHIPTDTFNRIISTFEFTQSKI